MIYDVALDAQPLSLTMLVALVSESVLSRAGERTDTREGRVARPRARDDAPESKADSASMGDVDADSIGGYGARGRGQFTTPNLGGLLSTNNLLVGALGVHYDVDLAGISATQPGLMRGTAALDVEHTVLDSIRYSPSRLRLHFANGEMRIDRRRFAPRRRHRCCRAESRCRRPRRGIRSFSRSTSIRWADFARTCRIPTRRSSARRRPCPIRSSGTREDQGSLTGTLDTLNVQGRLQGSNIYLNRDRGEALKATFNLRNVLGNYSGWVEGRIDTVTYAGIALDTIGGRLTIDDSSHRRFIAGAVSHTGPTAAATGDWATSGDTNFVRVDSFGLTIGDAAWRLAAPSRFIFDTVGTRLDSLMLRNRDSGVVVARGNVPATGPATAELRALHIPLRDIGEVAQVTDTIGGTGNLIASVSGTRAKPRVTASADLTGVRWYGVDVERITLNALAANARVDASVDVIRDGKPAITAKANLPIDVSLFTAKARDEAISGTLDAKPTDLGLLNVFPQARQDYVGRAVERQRHRRRHLARSRRWKEL